MANLGFVKLSNSDELGSLIQPYLYVYNISPPYIIQIIFKLWHHIDNIKNCKRANLKVPSNN